MRGILETVGMEIDSVITVQARDEMNGTRTSGVPALQGNLLTPQEEVVATIMASLLVAHGMMTAATGTATARQDAGITTHPDEGTTLALRDARIPAATPQGITTTADMTNEATTGMRATMGHLLHPTGLLKVQQVDLDPQQNINQDII